MSLDIYLHVESPTEAKKTSGIYIRKKGRTVEITRQEWDQMYPNKEPIIVPTDDIEDKTEVFHANITHNLNRMADEAGIYYHIWQPERAEIERAEQLIQPLTWGVEQMKVDPDRFTALNPKNGWGSYDDFVPWLERLIKACKQYPDAKVTVSV